MRRHYPPRVAPFGYPRINACKRLPGAYRSLLRPSSPASAKASTVCPSMLDHCCQHRCCTRLQLSKSPACATLRAHTVFAPSITRCSAPGLAHRGETGARGPRGLRAEPVYRYF
jgi:hypothetical protein